ncbi:MAG TPA: MauE/DoxX family redox-associated membrane protein [Bryobacteraceae bacterium]|nr:MauE/DoxX family redox-associated membrane protein [Bryobacteraceae bacterium]
MLELALLVARLVLSAVFLLAGVAKLSDPKGTNKALRDFGVPRPLTPFLVLALSLVEIAVAVALVPIAFAWYGACGVLALVAIFVIGIVVTLARGRDPECHCFGRLDSSRIGWKTLVRNGVLGALAGWLVSRGPAQIGPSLWQHLAVAGENERRFFIFAAFVMCLLFYRALRPKPARKPESVETEWDDAAELEQEEEPASVPDEAPSPELSEPQPCAPRATAPAVKRAKTLPAPEVQPLTAAMKKLLEAGDGLPIGTPAPQFALPAVNGERRSLLALRSQGKTICLVFASPHCDPCRALFPHISRWAREYERTFNFVVVGRGAAMENTAKNTGLDLSRVLLQRAFELSNVYGIKSTPAAVLVGADGLIQSQIAVGRNDIRQLVVSTGSGTRPVT